MTNQPVSSVRVGVRKVLLIDDDPDLLTLQQMSLRGIEGLEATTAGSAEEGLARIRDEAFDLVLTDLNLPGQSGLDFITSSRAGGFCGPILVLTSYGSIDAATEALRRGAADFLQKPVAPERLRALVRQLLASAPPVTRNAPEPPANNASEFEGILGRSAAMRAVFDRIDRVAKTDATVLIVGESGTGKELVARAIHQRSARSVGPLVPVHTGAIPRELIASDLFGHEKGSFTGAVSAADGKFEAAAKGTLFLDEIGTMDVAVQVALLRVLETFRFTPVGGRREREADVRVVAATNRDLLEMVREGTFREDLYYRLNVFTVQIPPLRARLDDLALIAQHYLAAFASRYRMPARRFSRGAIDRMAAHTWPGNVRELRNVMEQTAVFARGEEVQADEVQLFSTAVLSTPSHHETNGRASMTPSTPPFATESTPATVATSSVPVAHVAMASSSFESAPDIAPVPESRSHHVSNPPIAAPVRKTEIDPFPARAREMLGNVAAKFDDQALVLQIPLGTTLDEVEKQLILRTLTVLGGNKLQAAKVLKISRRCLYNKLAAYGASSHETNAGSSVEETEAQDA